MVAGVLTCLSATIARLIVGIGAVCAFKAVYVDHRKLTCACVGGSSNVTLGLISLLENFMMVGMAAARPFAPALHAR